jgi:hypothetical protein
VRVALLGGVAVAGVLVAHLIDPIHQRWLPKCPFHELTGLWCPVCGSTRAASALAHGNVVATMRHNALFVPALVALAWLWAAMAARAFVPRLAERRWALGAFAVMRPVWLLGVVGAFVVLRNVPGLPAHLLSS